MISLNMPSIIYVMYYPLVVLTISLYVANSRELFYPILPMVEKINDHFRLHILLNISFGAFIDYPHDFVLGYGLPSFIGTREYRYETGDVG